MKLAVFGQRSIEDNDLVTQRLTQLVSDKCWDMGCVTYLHGGARGPQRAVLYGMEGIADIVLFQPWSMVSDKIEFTIDMFNWRNKQILDNADEVVIFDNGTPDREADYVLHYVRRHGRKHYVIKM